MSPIGALPPAPRPSQDLGVARPPELANLDVGIVPSIGELDIFTLTPKAAMKVFTAAMKSTLIDEPGTRGPPTPPISSPTTPRSDSFADQACLHIDGANDYHRHDGTRKVSEEIPRHHQTPIGSPEAHPQDMHNTQPPHLQIDVDDNHYERQCQLMSRAFYSKSSCTLPMEAYLERIHRYCPLSTATWLAAACYIQRLTSMLWPSSPMFESKNPMETTYVRVEPRSAHRIVLAALRVAHKAMEDNNHRHVKFAGVGGVSNSNLTRLELAMSYLLDFKLRCSEEELQDAARSMIGGNPEVVDS